MIKLVKVNKYFNRRKRNEIHVIKNTTLELEDKGLVAILGNSGSGKTTLLNAIGGLDKVSKGKIYLNGKKITKVPRCHIDKVRTLSVGYIFQNYNLMNQLTVFENVAIALKMIGIKNKKEIEKRVSYVLDVLGIAKYRNRPSYMLSGGERQKVGIARAIVKNPSVIIADEPTGNLDSKNSLEIMNILKSISKEKLVILVTHEKELAEFYASRILKIVDGKIESDEKNDLEKELDYRLYSNIYLKDMENHQTIVKDGVTIDYYSEQKEPLSVTLVFKNGNIYVQAERKIEVVDSNSGIELINDHYQKLSKDTCHPDLFNNEILEHKRRPRYSSIYNCFTMLWEGFRKILGYTPLKKILLLGFFVSSMFILYALSSMQGIQQVKDETFITTDSDYLRVTMAPISVEDYLNLEAMDTIDYILPGNSLISFSMVYDDYYQTVNSNEMFSASLSDVSKLAQDDLLEGRLPENRNEVILDKLVFDKIMQNENAKQAGYLELKDFLGHTIKTSAPYDTTTTSIDSLEDFTIVGISNQNRPCVYTSREMFIPIVQKSNETQSNFWSFGDTTSSSTKVTDVSLVEGKIKITKGRMPKNDYEVIVNKSQSGVMKLNKKIDVTINKQKLKVVGYYDTPYVSDAYYTNFNTAKYQVIETSQNMIISPKDKAVVLQSLREQNINVEDIYEKDKSNYLLQNKDRMKATIIVACIILAISLVEIFLMVRASFLSRIKEIGILRAIGVKRSDIIKMFLGEILAINLLTGIPGIAFMAWILNGLIKVSYYFQYVLNWQLILLSIIILFAFHIIIGLLPVFHTLRKTPIRILSSNSVD